MSVRTVGAAAWLLASPVFLIVNVIAGRGWTDPPYSWAENNISDLGNVGCGLWDTTRPRLVCSPWHAVMNGGLAVTGFLLILGVLCTWSIVGRQPWTRIAQLLLLVGATGYVLAGVYPADVNENNHFLAALFVFVLGNLGLLVAALGRSPVLSAGWSLGLGLIGVAGTVLFLAQVDLGIGLGGMERVAVFPFLMWTVVMGIRVLKVHSVHGAHRVHGVHSGRDTGVPSIRL